MLPIESQRYKVEEARVSPGSVLESSLLTSVLYFFAMFSNSPFSKL